MVQLVDECILKLFPARCRADIYDSLLPAWIGEGESAIEIAARHKILGHTDKLSVSSGILNGIEHIVYVLNAVGKKEVNLPSPYSQDPPYHIMSSQKMGMFNATVLIQNSSKALVGDPSTSSI